MNLTTKATMSSLEIAALTGKEHKNVMRDIKVMLEELGGELSFEHSYLSEQNKELPCYSLPKRECLILVSGYNIKMRAAIIDRWQELEVQVKSPPRVSTVEEQLPLELTQRNFSAAKILAEAFGLEGNAALLSADAVTKQITGISPMDILGITHLVKKVQERDLTPTEIGKLLIPEASARAVNLRLMQAGLQYKKGEVWFPTEEGSKYSVLLDTRKKHSDGTMIVQLKWNSSIKDLI